MQTLLLRTLAVLNVTSPLCKGTNVVNSTSSYDEKTITVAS